jgi:putative iron-dependent peroxidase
MKSHPSDAFQAPGGLPGVAQAVVAPLTRAAIFLVATVNPGTDNRRTIRSFCGDLAALLRAVEFRDIEAGLSCDIRAKRMDLCFELATQIMARIGDAVSPADEVHGFRYFDDRDLIGFVDGTENPRGDAAIEAVLVGAEDATFAGGSYVIVQKYLHDHAFCLQLQLYLHNGAQGRLIRGSLIETASEKL